MDCMVKSRATAPRRAGSPQLKKSRNDGRHIAQMKELVVGAKKIADTTGERFVAYLLAIVIEEFSQMEDRRKGQRPSTFTTSTGPAKTEAS